MNHPVALRARIAQVESLDHEGRGVARVDGKTVFIDGALPGETVTFETWRRKPRFEMADVSAIIASSSQRVTPRCPHFGTCGGCSMQHLDVRAQVAAKQRVLEDNLERIGRVRPEIMLPAIHGPAWGYRYRARFSVRYVHKRGGALVGFHEKRSTFIAEMGQCHVVPPFVSAWIAPLRTLVDGLSIRDRLPQIELAVGESVSVLVIRHLAPLTPDDESAMRTFADRHGACIWLQPGGPETAAPFHPLGAPDLDYLLPEFDLRFGFAPTEFTQVNPGINRVLVRRAVELLDPGPGDRIADLFCGLGNFSLALARRGATVLGLEGSEGLVQRARANARINGLESLATFEARDLFAVSAEDVRGWGRFDKMLIDPPRDGAMSLVRALEAAPPQRIVYVSCSPSTLARDAEYLVHVLGYRLAAAGVVNMFPHTSHVESIALFNL